MQGLLDLTKEQFLDLETLRRIYLLRRASLARERSMLVHQIAKVLGHAEDTVPLPGNSKVCLNASSTIAFCDTSQSCAS